MTHTSVLHRLQDIDSDSDARRARLDDINAVLGQNEEVRAARERLETAETTLRVAQADVNQLELEIGSLEDKANATSDRLYSGTVTNPKELQDLELELESLGKRRDGLEESLLEAMVAVDDGDSKAESARAELAATEEAWASDQGDLTAEKRDLEARLGELNASREELLAQIDGPSLEAYEKLRAKLGGVAVATIEGGVCAACGVQPASSVAQKARHGDVAARCPNCQRILYDGQ